MPDESQQGACISVVNPHTPSTRSPATIGEDIARSEWGRPKTESSQSCLPVCGSKLVNPSHQLVKINFDFPLGEVKIQGVE